MLRRRRPLNGHDGGNTPLDDLAGLFILDLVDDGIALGGLQIEPEAAVLVPPEPLLEGGAVPCIAEHRGDHAPGLERLLPRPIFVILGVARAVDEIAHRAEEVQFVAVAANRISGGQLAADILDATRISWPFMRGLSL